MKFTIDMLGFTKAVDLLCDLFGGSLLRCSLKRGYMDNKEVTSKEVKHPHTPRVFPEPYATVPRHL